MSRSSRKLSISFDDEDWKTIMNQLSTDDEGQVRIITRIEEKLMSRSSRGSEPTEAAVLSPLEFTGIHGKVFAISSKEREPIEQLLPVLSGNILILTGWTPNLEGINSAMKKGLDKDVIQRSITNIVEVQLLMKTRNVAQAFDHVIIDRIDEIDNGKNKMHKAAQIKGMLTIIPGLLGQANLFITTMMGIPILYEGVDFHKTV